MGESRKREASTAWPSKRDALTSKAILTCRMTEGGLLEEKKSTNDLRIAKGQKTSLPPTPQVRTQLGRTSYKDRGTSISRLENKNTILPPSLRRVARGKIPMKKKRKGKPRREERGPWNPGKNLYHPFPSRQQKEEAFDTGRKD